MNHGIGQRIYRKTVKDLSLGVNYAEIRFDDDSTLTIQGELNGAVAPQAGLDVRLTYSGTFTATVGMNIPDKHGKLPILRRFTADNAQEAHDLAAEFISTLEDHEEGLYTLDLSDENGEAAEL